MKFTVIASAALSLSGCGVLFPAQVPPEKSLPVSNSAYQVDQLFTDKNGCTLYRFFDKGDFRYYLVGPAGAQMLPSTTHVTDTTTDTVVIDSGTGGGGGGHGGGHKK